MHLLSQTLQPPQGVIQAVSGIFSGLSPPGTDEFVTNSGTYLNLYQHFTNEDNDNEENIVRKLATTRMYCHVLNIAKLRLPESDRDMLVVTSDSGNITILNLINAKFTTHLSIPFGRVGLRAYEPGYHLAVSPCGRAIMSSSLVKNKVAWNVTSGPALSDPVETTRSNLYVYCSAALDVGKSQPKFAFLEQRGKPTEEAKPKMVSIYELDASINSIVRRSDHIVAISSNYIVAVPGPSSNGPGGVLVCAKGTVHHFTGNGQEYLLPLPQRHDIADTPYIVSSAVFSNEDVWFILLQTEHGDLFMFDYEEGSPRVRVFDWIPQAKCLLILSQGVLVAIEECGPIVLYTITDVDADMVDSFQSKPLGRVSEFHKFESMDRLIRMSVVPSGHEELGKLLTIHGSSQSSSFQVTTLGIPTNEIFRGTIGGISKSIRCVKKSDSDLYDSFLLVSTSESTRVVEIKGGQVVETNNESFVTNAPTLDVFRQFDMCIQIHSMGIRVLVNLPDGSVKQRNWSRGDGKIVAATHTTGTACVAFDDNTITLFTISSREGLREESSHVYSGQIDQLAISSSGLSGYLAIASDSLVSLVSVSPGSRWSHAGQLTCTGHITSLLIQRVQGLGELLYIGQANGTITRVPFDAVTGEFGTPQFRSIGYEPVVFSRTSDGIMALSSKTWIGSGLQLERLAYDRLDTVSPIRAEFCPDGGYVGVSGNSIVVFTADDLTSKVTTKKTDLLQTPRQIISFPETNQAVVFAGQNSIVYDIDTMDILNVIPLGECIKVTSALRMDGIIIVGFCEQDTKGGILVLNHSEAIVSRKTMCDGIPRALCRSEDQIIAGIGRTIRVYEIGRSQLLRKCESRCLPHDINYVNCIGNRIIAGDSAESFHFLKYDSSSGTILPFADDSVPRFPLCAVTLDRSTVACGDRFGNIAVLRLPSDVSDEAEMDPSGVGAVWERAEFCGAPNKLDQIASYHIGSPVTGLSLSASGQTLVYSTVMGEIGLLIPLAVDTDVKLIKKLEKEMRKLVLPLTSRRHDQFRSHYAPVKGVSDGDLIKEFYNLKETEKSSVAQALGCTTFDITRLIAHYDAFL